MTIYAAPIIGTGTEEDPRRPDLPEGITWASVGDHGDVMHVRTDADLDLPVVE